MKVRRFVGALALVAVTALVTQAVTQDGMDEHMKKWMEFATPGKEHQEMAAKAGKWDLDISMWMDPAAPPTKSTGTAEYKVAMDGRYVIEHVDSMMDMGGGMMMPFKGMAVAGFDNMKKKYFSTWIDNMGTGVMISEGTKSGNVTTLEGMHSDCMSGQSVKHKMVMTDVDKDNFKFEMFGPGADGKDMKHMEIVYKRNGAKNAQ